MFLCSMRPYVIIVCNVKFPSSWLIYLNLNLKYIPSFKNNNNKNLKFAGHVFYNRHAIRSVKIVMDI